MRGFNLSQAAIDAAAQRELLELERRERAYRGEDRPVAAVRGQTAILVDDGLATGASMRAAIKGVCAKGPEQIVVAVPAAASKTCELFQSLVDEIVCVETPEPFCGVGRWYQDFSQTTDEEVQILLEQTAQELKY